jgi:hypothetical protein
MSRKRKRRQHSADQEAPDRPARGNLPTTSDEQVDVDDEDQREHLGDRVQARLDADIGLDHSLPPNILRSSGQVLLVVSFLGLALAVPADWVTWSRLLVGSVGGFVVWVTATASTATGTARPSGSPAVRSSCSR